MNIHKLEELPTVEGQPGISSLEEVGQQGGQGWRSRPASSTQRPAPRPVTSRLINERLRGA